MSGTTPAIAVPSDISTRPNKPLIVIFIRLVSLVAPPRLLEVRGTLKRITLAVVFGIAPRLAFAHSQAGRGFGFLAGLEHPLTGLDHMLAMLAVGIWGAVLRGRAVWVLPVAFPLIMALGAVAGILALPMLPIEPGIAASVIGLGFVIALNFRPPLGGAVALIGVFAIFHGYAHGVELPGRADALAYCIGFMLATGLIHLSGIAIGQTGRLRGGPTILRYCGAAIACCGLALAGHLLFR